MEALRRSVKGLKFKNLPLFCLQFHSLAKRNDRPIIGILAQEATFPKTSWTSYIHASHVQFLELAGARVVPVKMNLALEEYEKLFNCINGILFPGDTVGSISSSYARSAKIFYELAIEANKKGDYFPVCGICRGLQILCCLTCGKDLFTMTETRGVSLPLNFSKDAKDSRIFSDFPDEVIQELASEPLSKHTHMQSLALSDYNSNEKLKKFYKVLTTSTDGKVEFVSTLEACDYPIYAMQWHPEKNAFECTKPFIPHFPSAVKATYHMAEFVVCEARKNFHRFESVEEERKALIYNYTPVYTQPMSGFGQMCYFC